jgi:hypothetical protein
VLVNNRICAACSPRPRGRAAEAIAKDISDYLIMGMHHSTPDAQRRMADLIRAKDLS